MELFSIIRKRTTDVNSPTSSGPFLDIRGFIWAPKGNMASEGSVSSIKIRHRRIRVCIAHVEHIGPLAGVLYDESIDYSHMPVPVPELS